MIMSLLKKWLFMISLGVVLAVAGCGDASENSPEAGSGEEAAENGEAEEGQNVDVDEIVGIDPGSGTMIIAEEAIEAYDLDVELTPSSDATMVAALDEAIRHEEDIVVTGWQPHWKFNEYDLKFLDDPQGVLGESENIHTMVREGLQEDHPQAYEVFDNFYWEIEDMNAVMAEFSQDEDIEPRHAAANWIDNNQDKVDEWTEGVESVEGESIEIAYVAWDSELASTNVITLVLEEVGYDVEMSLVEMGVAFSGLSAGDIDSMLIAWLPIGAASYYEKYEDEIVDLGPNLEGAQQGFVVPEYMNIDSVEDLPQN